MTRRALPWIVPGDPAATLAALARDVEVGRLNRRDRIRATWLAQALAAMYPPPSPWGAKAGALVAALDPTGTIPPEPDVNALRGWIALALRDAGRGYLSALARAAGVKSAEISMLRTGRPMTPAKRERVAAALIAGVPNPKSNCPQPRGDSR